MKTFLENLELRWKLVVMLAVPIMATLWFAGGNLFVVVPQAMEAAPVSELILMGNGASTLVHSLQKERGASAGFVGSGGKSFAAILPGLRKETSANRAALESFVETFDAEYYGSTFASSLNAVMTDLRLLEQHRSKISALSISKGEAVAYYTKLNKDYLDLIGQMPDLISFADLGLASSAYGDFLKGKELAGIQRAVMTGVLAKDVLTLPEYSRISQLIEQQKGFIAAFLRNGTTEAKRAYELAQTNPSFAEVDHMVETTFGKFSAKVEGVPFTGASEAIDSVYWFDTITQKIDQLKIVEDLQTEELLAMTKKIRSDATFSMVVSSSLVAVAVALSCLFGVWFTRIILNQLGADPQQLQTVVSAVRDGDLEIDLATDMPATGIYQSMQEMQQNLRNRTEKDKAALAESTRIEQALDNVNTNVMMCDNSFNVIYVNTAATSMFAQAESSMRAEMPGFNAAELIGSSIDGFHANPNQHKQILAALKTEHTTELKIGGHTFSVIANPVIGGDGERLGTVLEWDDRTEILEVEHEVEQVVSAAMNGKLDARIDTTDKSGFFKTLSDGMNSLVETTHDVTADASRMLGALADGRLTESVTREYDGDFAGLKQDANSSVAKLVEVVSQIQIASESVKNGAREIAEGNADLSQRTEEQAGSLEQTSSNMAEMTSTVRENAQNATQANQLSTEVKDQAEQGGEVVNEAIGAMGEINESSKKIADIIGTIDEIAFQTNLLALNASVEAARAGEQGRGFAVVASEVRNLAGRSADAAKEIKDLIEDSVERVENGTQLVNKSGEVLTQIIAGITETSNLVNEIAVANTRQSSGIDEVNESVAQMDSMTQQNAALVEQAAAASESLGEQARGLDELMRFFTLSGSPAAGTSNTSASAQSEDRRGETRPWSGPTGSATEHAGNAATGTDDNWSEF